MNLLKTLRADSKIVSVVGSGGKSTYLCALAHELAHKSSPTPTHAPTVLTHTHGPYAPADKNVLLLTTTHMVAPSDFPYLEDPSEEELATTLATLSHKAAPLNPVLCIGKTTSQLTPEGQPKITAPSLPVATLARYARYLLIEADGSKRMPLKLHAAHEPVVPPESDTCICIVGASGFMHPASQVLHHWDSRGQDFGITHDTLMTPELVARLIADEIARGVLQPDVLVVNQTDTKELQQIATDFCQALKRSFPSIKSYVGTLRPPNDPKISHTTQPFKTL